MNFVGDESLEFEIIQALRRRGDRVFAISEECAGIPDPEVLAISVSRGEPLITNDKDFGDLIFRDQQATAGVILLRLQGMSPDERAARLVAWLNARAGNSFEGYAVLSRDTARERPSG